MTHDRKTAGFKQLTRVDAARERLLSAVEGLSRTETAPVDAADGRVLAADAAAPRAVPHYERAAADGFAVRAADTFGAGSRSPAVLDAADDGAGGPNRAVRVHAGSELPEGADAVVTVEAAERRGDRVEVFDAAAGGQHVTGVGEDVAAGQHLYGAGHRLRPSDLGLLRAAGEDSVEVYERPSVGVLPASASVVDANPEPGEAVETNGRMLAQYVSQWGGEAAVRDPAGGDEDALRAAVRGAVAAHDLVVTTGGVSVGADDIVPEVVADLGEVLVHGVAVEPGHPVALGVVEDTPVVALPGSPVAAIVGAVQFLRPALGAVGHRPKQPHPTTEAELTRKVASGPGTRSFVRVAVDEPAGGDGGSDSDGPPAATPTRTDAPGVLSSVALADGWVVVPEGREGYDAGATVAVQHWEGSA